MTTLSNSELYDRFLELESEYEVFNIKPHGVPIWERIRYNLYQEIRRQATESGQAHTQKGFTAASYRQGIKLWAKNALFKNPYLASQHDFLFYGHPRRKQLEDETWWDLYCDPLYESIDIDYLHVEEPYLMSHCTPAKTERLRYVDFIHYSGAIRRNLGLSDVRINGTERQRLQQVNDTIEKELDVEVDIIRQAEAKLTRRDSILDLYKLFLRRVNPDVATVLVSYGKHTFLEACHDLGIPTAELQHGTPDANHLGYSFRGSRTKETFPDYFLSWGDFWSNLINFPIPDEHVISVGYPYLEHRIESYAHVEQKDQILFLSQGTIGKQLSKFAVEVAEHPDIDHDIVYKLHPGEYDRWQDIYPWLVDTPVTIIDENEPPLYRLFAESTAQVGVYSTALYEGLCFGLKTYLYDCPDVEKIRVLLNEGVATLVSESEALTSIEDGSAGFDREKFFAPDATENIAAALSRIASK
jgi:hypothetical protein